MAGYRGPHRSIGVEAGAERLLHRSGEHCRESHSFNTANIARQNDGKDAHFDSVNCRHTSNTLQVKSFERMVVEMQPRNEAQTDLVSR